MSRYVIGTWQRDAAESTPELVWFRCTGCDMLAVWPHAGEGVGHDGDVCVMQQWMDSLDARGLVAHACKTLAEQLGVPFEAPPPVTGSGVVAVPRWFAGMVDELDARLSVHENVHGMTADDAERLVPGFTRVARAVRADPVAQVLVATHPGSIERLLRGESNDA